MSNEASREEFEVWAKAEGLDTALWWTSTDTYKLYATNDAWDAWQAGRKALEAEQAQEPCLKFIRMGEPGTSAETISIVAIAALPKDGALLYTAPPPAEPTVKQPLSTERSELIGRLKKGMKLTNAYGLAGTALALQSAAAMLEADAAHIALSNLAGNAETMSIANGMLHKLRAENSRLKAQQVAVPAEVLSAISRAGFAVVNTQYGYELHKLGGMMAHTPPSQLFAPLLLAHHGITPQGDKQ